MRRALAVCAVVAALGSAPAAAEDVSICHDYGCQARTTVHYSAADLDQVARVFDEARSPATERDAMARAVAWLYFYAAQQSPIWRDRGENFDDDETQPGRMDCIDHSTNTTAFLRLLERRGWLRFHAVGEPVMRGVGIDDHWAARVVERGAQGEWVVDTWFYEPGVLAAVFPLAAWRAGARPPGPVPPRIAAP
jgi:hypothetical protein